MRINIWCSNRDYDERYYLNELLQKINLIMDMSTLESNELKIKLPSGMVLFKL